MRPQPAPQSHSRLHQWIPLVFLLFGLPGGSAADTLPWREAGLSPRQAADHLLNRFGYGPRPGEVDAVVAMGLEVWLERQIAAAAPERRLERALEGFESLDLPAPEIARRYPSPGMVLILARQAGVIDPEREQLGESGSRRELRSWAASQGFRSQRELIDETRGQKLLRAVLAENQLHEVLTDFWTNHLAVSGVDPDTRAYVLAYERDAIRPRAMGSFAQLLAASARHPAMLLYLDNARSTAADGVRTTLETNMDRIAGGRGRGGLGRAGGGRGGGVGRGGGFGVGEAGRMGGMGRSSGPRGDQRGEMATRANNRPRGLNENYARELLELHTIGVDGGYQQKDVVEVARAFTGWSVVPPGDLGQGGQRRLDPERAKRAGFVVEGDFVFRADTHDAEAKVVLGTRLRSGRGIEDGEEVLALLAAHPSTARHVAAKLAQRFVADDPAPELVERLAAVWVRSKGDTRAMVRAIAAAPEFWSAGAAKIKSPLELVASSLRATGAEVTNPGDVTRWIERMGQPLYAPPAPTGFPETAASWVSTGALLSRMHFAVQLATGRLRGVEIDLEGLLGEGEPESRREGLERTIAQLLPSRDPAPLIEALLPAATQPEFAQRVVAADSSSPANADEMMGGEEPQSLPASPGASASAHTPENSEPLQVSAVQQVAAVVLGSPEFQRR